MGLGGSGLLFAYRRKGQRERGPLVDNAFYFDVAAVVLHVLVCDKKTQAGTIVHGALIFGGKIGVEDQVHVRFGDTDAGIPDFNLDRLRFPF